MDVTGPHLHAVFPHGSTDTLPFATMGSGSLAAMFMFESRYKENVARKEWKLCLLRYVLVFSTILAVVATWIFALQPRTGRNICAITSSLILVAIRVPKATILRMDILLFYRPKSHSYGNTYKFWKVMQWKRGNCLAGFIFPSRAPRLLRSILCGMLHSQSISKLHHLCSLCGPLGRFCRCFI